MTISFVPMAESAAESQALVQFLTSNRFPFHVKAEHSQESARSLVETREDNIAMRKTFLRAGFLKEAHYRLGWPTADGTRVASVAYAILRQDWVNQEITPFEWEDVSI